MLQGNRVRNIILKVSGLLGDFNSYGHIFVFKKLPLVEHSEEL